MPSYHALFTLEPAYRARHNFKSTLELNDAELNHLYGLVDRLDEDAARAGRRIPYDGVRAVHTDRGFSLALLPEEKRSRIAAPDADR
jgi:hypothetical protein